MTTPAKPAAYTQCKQCGFWHTPAEPHCANCGASLVSDVGSFTAGFKKLEDEYFRLQIEDEVRQLTK